MDSMITHDLDGTGKARYGGETAVMAWIRRSLTAYMGREKYDTVVRRL